MDKKIVFIDMDACIVAWHDPISPTRFTYEAFLEKLPITSVIYQIKKLYGNYKLIIFSSTPNDEVTQAKRDWVNKYVKPILNISEEIYVPWPQINKIDYLTDWLLEKDILSEECILIDDTLIYLQRSEKELGIQAIHPSYLIALYENNKLTNLENYFNEKHYINNIYKSIKE